MLTVLTQIRPALSDKVSAAFSDVRVVPIAADAAVPADVRGEVLLTYPWNNPHLAELLTRGVRWIHLVGTGVDAFPLHLLSDQQLTCSRGASGLPIAEWVLAVMLAFEKDLPEAWIHTPPAKGWSRGGRGGTLHGRTLGLVGFGGIGREVAARALPFGMRVLAHRRSGAAAGMDGVEIVALAELVAAADHIVIAAPATAATHHLFDAALLARCRPTAHLINVARGALVDQTALRAALDDGRLAMASLDAVDPEPLPDGHWLYTHPRVRLSPHLSWQMPGAAQRLLDCFIDNVRRYRAGEPLSGVVDRAAGY
jgi:phosphoglycerate dehydrogenase-like enzyme